MCAHGNGTFGFNDFRFRLFFSLTLFHHRNGRLHKNNEEKYIVQVHFCTRALTRHEEHRKTGNTRELMEPWSVHREHWTPSSIFRWCITLNESIWPFRSLFFFIGRRNTIRIDTCSIIVIFQSFRCLLSQRRHKKIRADQTRDNRRR